MPSNLPQKIIDQITKVGLPRTGKHTFEPRLTKTPAGQPQIQKKAVRKGPKKGKRGYVDDQGRIWIKDRGHSGLPDHWDVQLNDGDDYIRVDRNGNELP